MRTPQWFRSRVVGRGIVGLATASIVLGGTLNAASTPAAVAGRDFQSAPTDAFVAKAPPTPPKDIIDGLRTVTNAPVAKKANPSAYKTQRRAPIQTAGTANALAAFYAISGQPTSFTTGATSSYQVTVTNTGTQVWPAGGTNPVHIGVHFATKSGGYGTSGSGGPGTSTAWATDQHFTLPNDVQPGQSVSVTLGVTAPTTAGNYVLEYEMVQENIAWFAQYLDHTMPVSTATGTLAAAYAVSGQPSSFVPSGSASVQITVTNTGTQTWSSGGTTPVHLGIHFATVSGGYPTSGNDTTWATSQHLSLPANVSPGASVTMTVTVNAPATAGNYVLEYEMVEENVAWFSQYEDSGGIPVAVQTWSGASNAGSGAAPWETFNSDGVGNGTGLDVNVANGNLLVSTQGLGFPGINGMDMTTGPSWNSASRWINGSMGNGWLLGTGRDMGLQIGSTSATFYDDAGHGWAFPLSSGAYTAPAGADAKLVKNSDGTYTLTENASAYQLLFDANGFFTGEQNRTGNKISYSYDGSHRLTQIANPAGQATTFIYDGNGRLYQVTAPDGRPWQYLYDGSGNLTKITDPANRITQFGYTNNLITQITDPNNNVTNITYDASNRVSTIVHVTNTSNNTGPTWTYTYNTGSTQVSDSNSHSMTYAYDSSNRVTSTTYPDQKIGYTYWNADNQITQDKLPSGNATNYQYSTDGNNNLTQIALATGAKATFAYTNTSFPYLPSSSTDAEGNTTSYGYTSQGLLNSTTDALQHQATAIYNSDGTLQSATDENKHTTSYGYNTLGLPNLDTPPSPLGATSYVYNSYNLLDHSVDGKQQTTQYSWTQDNEISNAHFQDGNSIGYAYDSNGNLKTESDSITGSTNYQYNALDQLTQKVLPNGYTTQYTWDGVGNLLTTVDKTGSAGTITYGYTVNDELQTVKDSQQATTTLYHDQDGNLTQVAYPNGVSENMSYDTAGQLTRIWATNNGGSTLTSYTYSYVNPANSQQTDQRYSVTDASGNVTSYTYDALNRLTQAIQKNSGGAQIASYAYALDPVGNITSQTINGAQTGMTYNAADQLTGAGSTNYGYDANGNMTTGSRGLGMAYNALDQTTSITPSGGSAISMQYDGPGQRQRWTNGTNSYHYTAAGMDTLTASSGTTYFTTTPGGDPLSERIGSSTYYYLHDGLNSVVALVDGSQNVVNRYSYDPYGNTTSVTEGVTNPYRFTGALWDSQTGLYKMGERYYDPSIGRFTQTDPLGDGYKYAAGNPVNYVDPAGTDEAPPIDRSGPAEGGADGSSSGEETYAQRVKRVLKTPVEKLNKADRRLRSRLQKEQRKASKPPKTHRKKRPSTYGTHTKPHSSRTGQDKILDY